MTPGGRGDGGPQWGPGAGPWTTIKAQHGCLATMYTVVNLGAQHAGRGGGGG